MLADAFLDNRAAVDALKEHEAVLESRPSRFNATAGATKAADKAGDKMEGRPSDDLPAGSVPTRSKRGFTPRKGWRYLAGSEYISSTRKLRYTTAPSTSIAKTILPSLLISAVRPYMRRDPTGLSTVRAVLEKLHSTRNN